MLRVIELFFFFFAVHFGHTTVHVGTNLLTYIMYNHYGQVIGQKIP